MKNKVFSTKTVATLWTDPYIASKMLAYHIDGSNDIASRNSSTIKKTVEFIINRLELTSAFSMCDFGCGPGLYTHHFNRLGIKTSGVDFSINSIEYAKNIDPDINYVHADYLSVDMNETYDLITQIYCDFSVFDPNERRIFLKNIYKHLNVSGYFFFDVHNLAYFDHVKEGTLKYQEDDGFFMAGHTDVTHEVKKYNDEKVTLNYYNVVGDNNIELYNWLKCYSKQEIKNLLELEGFRVLSYHDNTYGEVDDDALSFTVLCQKI